MAFVHTYTPHIKSTCVVCCMPKTYGVLLPHFSTIHSFSTLIITLFTIALIKCPVCLYSTFYLLFFLLVILTCTCHFLITLEHSQNHSVYKVLQVILLFVYVTRNTADVTTLLILWCEFLLDLCLTLSSMVLLYWKNSNWFYFLHRPSLPL